jgi:hypothetical protein
MSLYLHNHTAHHRYTRKWFRNQQIRLEKYLHRSGMLISGICESNRLRGEISHVHGTVIDAVTWNGRCLRGTGSNGKYISDKEQQKKGDTKNWRRTHDLERWERGKATPPYEGFSQWENPPYHRFFLERRRSVVSSDSFGLNTVTCKGQRLWAPLFGRFYRLTGMLFRQIDRRWLLWLIVTVNCLNEF